MTTAPLSVAEASNALPSFARSENLLNVLKSPDLEVEEILAYFLLLALSLPSLCALYH